MHEAKTQLSQAEILSLQRWARSPESLLFRRLASSRAVKHQSEALDVIAESRPNESEFIEAKVHQEMAKRYQTVMELLDEVSGHCKSAPCDFIIYRHITEEPTIKQPNIES